MTTQPLLIEIGTEELPPTALRLLSHSFTQTIAHVLQQAGVLAKDSKVQSFATPRRLSILANTVLPEGPDTNQIRKGPAVKAAFDADGKATKAAIGFAQSCGVKIGQLGREKTGQGEWLSFEQTIKGKSIHQAAQLALETAITQLPIPKRMRWGDNDAQFVRPVHWLLALYGDKRLSLEALGLYSGQETRGHRFHHPQSIKLNHANDYVPALQNAYVVADFTQRKEQITAQSKLLAKKVNGDVILDADLLDEVTALVEWPVALLGGFDQDYLQLPEEVLITSMRSHQKYFTLRNSQGQLLPHFICISNIKSTMPVKVLSGNERALKLRLSDAHYFWNQDKQKPLESHSDKLSQLLFHAKLGTVANKVDRLMISGKVIASLIDANHEHTIRAAALCKLDLLSHMVGEFPNLQGTMGCYYATLQHEAAPVCVAIEQHYWPRFSGDKIPQDKIAMALALADKLDTLTGIFATGELPTGDKDPYGLRRLALGVLRILIENKLDLSLPDLLENSAKAYQNQRDLKACPSEDTLNHLYAFIIDRLKTYYTSQGFEASTIKSVVAVAPTSMLDFDSRIRAVNDFFAHNKAAANALASANKRIANILKKHPKVDDKADATLFIEKAELALANQLSDIKNKSIQAFDAHKYAQGLSLLATLQSSVNDFFDQVLVMDNDPKIRNNRLALLATLRALFLRVADISFLNMVD